MGSSIVIGIIVAIILFFIIIDGIKLMLNLIAAAIVMLFLIAMLWNVEIAQAILQVCIEGIAKLWKQAISSQ